MSSNCNSYATVEAAFSLSLLLLFVRFEGKNETEKVRKKKKKMHKKIFQAVKLDRTLEIEACLLAKKS